MHKLGEMGKTEWGDLYEKRMIEEETFYSIYSNYDWNPFNI